MYQEVQVFLKFKMSNENKYIVDKRFSNLVAKTKVSHGRIETAIKVRKAETEKELNLESKRLKILNEIDKSDISEKINLPKELQNWQQLIVVIGNLNLKSITEVSLICKKLGYRGSLNKHTIKNFLITHKKTYFKYDKEKGWKLTNKGQNEFTRLKEFI
jgi:hypothetical protein